MKKVWYVHNHGGPYTSFYRAEVLSESDDRYAIRLLGDGPYPTKEREIDVDRSQTREAVDIPQFVLTQARCLALWRSVPA